MGIECRIPVYEVSLQAHLCATYLVHRRFIDPTLEHDLSSHDKPWALSPLISTMPYFSHTRTANAKGMSDLPQFPPPISITEDATQLSQAINSDAVSDKDEPVAELMKLHTSAERRAHFYQQEARKQISFGPHVSILFQI